MSCFVTGVTVICSGRPESHGMTLNTLTSISLDPPQVLISIGRNSRMRETVLADGAFTISVLSAELDEAARYFATSDRRYGSVGFRSFSTRAGGEYGHPIFTECLTWLECLLEHVRESGDHTVMTGRVTACGTGSGEVPLVFCAGKLTSHHSTGDGKSNTRSSVA